MKKFKIIKILSMTLTIIIITITPLMSYIQSEENSKTYAISSDFVQEMSKYLVPLAAYCTYSYMHANGAYESVNTAAQDIAAVISDMNEKRYQLYEGLTVMAKARLAKLYTDMNNYDINKTLGTTFSAAQMAQFDSEIQALKTKIINNEPLLNIDMEKIGVHNILANYIKSAQGSLKNDTLTATNYIDNGIVYTVYDNIRFLNIEANANFFKTLGSVIIDNTKVYRNSMRIRTLYKMNIISQNNYICLELQSDGNSDAGLIFSSEPFSYLKNKILVNHVYLDLKVNGTQIHRFDYELTKDFLTTGVGIRTFLQKIDPYVEADLTNTDYYINSDNYNLWDLLLIGNYGTTKVYSPDIYLGNQSISGVTSKAIETENAPDTPISQAEKLIANKTTETTYDNNVKAIENENTGDKDIIIAPNDTTIPTTSTADTNVYEPDPTVLNPDGTESNIPFLKRFLDWLKSMWAKLLALLASILSMLTNIFNKSTSEAAEGIDWGNFKGLFDIFYIFYYLIIIIIMILIKFLAVVFNLLSIPANAALFNSYPTIKAGLDYLKGLKIGGFNITLQQIFEYMFTVFFFLYVVTVLQKLYHSFALIERQTIKQEDRWNDNSNIIYRDGNYINRNTGEIQDYKYK